MKCTSRQHCEREELRAKLAGYAENISEDSGKIHDLEWENLGLRQRIAELEEQRNLIAEYLYFDPPFDECAGICIHTRASEYAGEIMVEPVPMDYYMAFLDCCKAALLEGDK